MRAVFLNLSASDRVPTNDAFTRPANAHSAKLFIPGHRNANANEHDVSPQSLGF
jgi:hypothetical protein